MNKVYMLKHPTRQLPMGIFSDYTTAADIVEKAFRLDCGQCIEEFELDPLKEKLALGLYPWAVYINVITKETDITVLGTLFTDEFVDYSHGHLACAYVFATNEEEAENRALEIWEDNPQIEIKVFSIFKVTLDGNGEISSVDKTTTYTTDGAVTQPTVKLRNENVEIRVLAESIDEAITEARKRYSMWIADQMEDLPEISEDSLA